jgi:uncharacterized delta-60 repeat protein
MYHNNSKRIWRSKTGISQEIDWISSVKNALRKREENCYGKVAAEIYLSQIGSGTYKPFFELGLVFFSKIDLAFTLIFLNFILSKKTTQMKRIYILMLCLIGLFSAHIAFGQDGILDPTFNPTDAGYGLGDGANGGIVSSILQPDGKIIVGGNFYNWNSSGTTRLARVNPDGSTDTSFDSYIGSNNVVNSIALQSNGKILIAGGFTQYGGIGRMRVARLNSNGTLDATFNPNAGANYVARAVAIQNDGKIIVGGDFNTFGGYNRSGVVRLDTNGAVDATFTVGTGTSYYPVRKVEIQPDGKILIAGDFYSYNGNSSPHIARLNTDGTLDTSFHVGTGLNGDVYAMELLSDGKIILGGWFGDYNGTTANSMVRINKD